MKRFLYHIDDDLIKSVEEVSDIPSDFIESHHDMGFNSIWYKVEGNEITQIVGEGITEEAIRRRVSNFISYLVTNIY